MKKIIILFITIWILLGFYRYLPTSFKTTYSFYHWTSSYEMIKDEKRPPKYIKVLDISFDETLLLRKTTFKTKPIHTIVPIIYIDNPLWSKMKAKTMVKKVWTALKQMPFTYDEIQVDCDWSDSTKESYFEFLKLFKEKSTKKISVTIRLHQVKYYTRTGVPPVDYGVLMYYNMSNFRDLKTKNYILDLEVAKHYHYNFENYPLALNLALPLYAQATIIRFGEVVGIIEGVRESVLNKNFKETKEHHYEITKTHYFNGRLLYEGDVLRIDEVSKELLTQTISELSKVMTQPKEIIFYRWGNKSFYDDAFLGTLCTKLR